MLPGLAALGRALGGLLLPPGCPACGAAPQAGRVFCPDCLAEVRLIGPWACPICGAPQEEGRPPRPCQACRLEPPPYDQALALALHQGPLARAVRRFKYGRDWASGQALASFLAQELDWGPLAGVDLLAPVPLHPRRLMRRGFNQALELGRALWRGLPPERRPRLEPRLLRRRRHTRPQVGLALHARQGNVAGAFALAPRRAALLPGRTVLLLDDVYTTGATVKECARVLKQAGAARVLVLTLARAPGRGPGPAEE